MRIRSRRGSVLAEASLIFPLVTGAVIALLYIIIGLFLSLQLQTSLHLDLRNEAGRNAETVHRTERAIYTDFEKGFMALRPILQGEKTRTYKRNALLLNKVEKTEKGRVYVIDEAELLRKVTLAKEILL